MANVEARMNLFHLLEQVIAYGVPGDVVDLGCNAGDSTIVMQRVVKALAPERQVHAFDSFEGLPDVTGSDAVDGVYGKGYMAAPLEVFRRKFDQVGLPHPHVHKGWFQDTVPQCLPDRIAFALIDGDLYESTKHVLPHVYERMAPGSIGMIAVYYDESVLPRRGLSGGYRSPGGQAGLRRVLPGQARGCARAVRQRVLQRLFPQALRLSARRCCPARPVCPWHSLRS